MTDSADIETASDDLIVALAKFEGEKPHDVAFEVIDVLLSVVIAVVIQRVEDGSECRTAELIAEGMLARIRGTGQAGIDKLKAIAFAERSLQ